MAPIEISGTGTLLLSDEQRKAQYLIVTCMFLDYPRHYSQNFRTPRNRLFFGYAHVMIGEYVAHEISLEYDGQIIYEWRNITAQLNTSIWCAQKKIRDLIIASNNGTPGTVPMVPVDEPIGEVLGCPVTEIRYELIPSVKVLTNCIFAPIVGCGENSIQIGIPVPPTPPEEGDKLGDKPPREEDGTGEPNEIGGIKPKGEPVDPPPPPGPEDEPLAEACTATYKIDFTVTTTAQGSGEVKTVTDTAILGGKILSVAPFYNPSFDSWAYRVERQNCDETVQFVNIYGTTGVSSLTGTHTITKL